MPDGVVYSENLLKLAAVLYRPEEDADSVLAAFAGKLKDEGRPIGGLVQRNRREGCGPAKLMEVIDLRNGEAIPICQALGPGSSACRLDEGGLAEAARAVTRAIDEGVDLIVVNKFGKTEAEGRGLRAEMAAAIAAGLPVLTAVPLRFREAWTAFTGGYGTTMICDGAVLADWWAETARRIDRARAAA